MMRSLYSGVSGLKSHQTRMDVIGNNIANINTIGFKGSRTTFSDMLSQLRRNASGATTTRGGVNPSQVGLGVDVESIDLMFQDSSTQQTGKNTDLALAGNGLFVLAAGEQHYYTRNGAFSFDEDGYYVMPGNGLRVQGWNASADGVIDTNSLSTDVIVPTGKFMEATETTSITYAGNLDKETQMIDRIVYTVNPAIPPANQLALVEGSGTTADGVSPLVTGTVDGDRVTEVTSVNVDGENILAATIYLKNGEKMTVTSGYYEVGRSVPITTIATIYDSLGSKHEVTVLIDKDSRSIDNNLADTDVAAHNTQTGFNYTYTAPADSTATNITPGKKYTAIEVTEPVYTANNEYYSASQVIATSGTVKGSNPPITATYNSQTKKYEDNTGVEYSASELNLDTSAMVLASDGTEVKLVEPPDTLVKYTDDAGNTQYVLSNDANVTATPAFDNRWRVYLAPGVGELGPASASFTNQRTMEEADGSTTVARMNNINFLYFDNRGNFVSNGQTEAGSIRFTYSNGNGADENTATFYFDGLTQFASSSTSFPTTNGNTAGILQSIAVDASGIISGTYTNGLVRQEAQIAIAQFTNAAGLTKIGTTLYQESNNSGTANIRTVDIFGLTVTSSALEMSGVDLATEFADMIVTQRGFQANSKMTTVADEMLETVVNMKR